MYLKRAVEIRRIMRIYLTKSNENKLDNADILCVKSNENNANNADIYVKSKEDKEELCY